MKTKRSFLIIPSCLLLSLTCGCQKEQEKLSEEPLVASLLADFSNKRAKTFFESDGWTNGDVFNVWWNADNVKYQDNGALLSISDRDGGSEATNDQYNSGELRSYQYFGYGDYQVKMKPNKKAGTTSSFFTCTGSYDLDENGNPNPHDEIDIEFLGKDTTKVQFNYFVNGEGGNEYMYDLGFDASEEVHEYGFRWSEDSIIWFVDGEAVHKVSKSGSNPLPSTPGRILMNYWCGNKKAENWMGKYDGSNEGGTIYQEVKTSATPKGNLPTDGFGEEEALCFESTEAYTVTPSGSSAKEVEVSYDDVKGQSYKNITSDISTMAKDKTKFSITIQNKGEATADIRIDIQGSNSVKTGEYSSTDACNQSSMNIGGKNARTDTEWGGSFISVDKGEEATLIITYSDKLEQGAVKNLLIYLDSSTSNNDSHANKIVLKDFCFAV